MRSTNPDPYEPLRERGVSPEVWAARGYAPYFGKRHPNYDPDAVLEELSRYQMAASQAAFYRKATDEAWNGEPPKHYADLPRARDQHQGRGDGLIMHKYPFPGEAPILPQLRPRYAVEMDARGASHRHDKAYRDRLDELARHVEKEHDGIVLYPWEWHKHPAAAKYLLCPLEREPVGHDHATDPAFQCEKGPSKLRAHIRAHHRGEDVVGEHEHRRRARGQHVANRFDVHPWALERLRGAELVYLVLEGTPKADAVLTQILADDLNASVCDVPSVTLWKDPGLGRIAERFFRGKRIVIVVDADYHENSRVVRQALMLRTRLDHDYGISCVAAPPDHRDENGKLRYKGVDDFLFAGGKLHELVVFDRTAPFSFALFASKNGTIRGSVVGLARLLRCRRDPMTSSSCSRSTFSAGYSTPIGRYCSSATSGVAASDG